jgi:hypothetical protein
VVDSAKVAFNMKRLFLFLTCSPQLYNMEANLHITDQQYLLALTVRFTIDP